jgi:hypothetical protein
MKKQILLLAFMAIATISMAQQVTPSFGIRGGLSSSGMQGDAVKNLNSMLDFANGMVTTGNRTGFFAGTYVNIPVSEKISVEPALYYTQKGYEMNGDFAIKGADFLGANAKAQLISQYVDLPVVLKANFNGFQVFAGPQVSYLAKADLRTTAGVLGFNVLNRKMDATEQFNRWDAAVTGGVGYQFANGINVMAAYDHGLSKVDANKSFNATNRSFKVGIGMTF